jgi:nucleotide-binding universal stress UspA family protein
MKKILVTTDLSARSDRAVLRAIKLAEEFNSKLTILHVIDDQIPRGLIDSSRSIAKDEIKNCLKDYNSDVKITIKIVEGNAYEQILKASYEEDFDLLVVGIHRHVDSNQPVIGQVIQRLVNFSHKPIIIVRNRYEKSYDKILSSIDFTNSSIISLKFAVKSFVKANFSLIHTYQVPFMGIAGSSSVISDQAKKASEDNLNEITQDIEEKYQVKINKIIKKGHIANILFEELEYLKPDLLVIGCSEKHFLARFADSSIMDQVLSDPPCDVLIVGKK